MKGRWNGLSVVKILIYLFFGVFLILPLLSVFLVSFTGQPVNLLGSITDPAIFSSTVEKFKAVSLENYEKIFTNKTYFSAVKNSLGLAVLVALIVIVMCIPIAYGIARTTMPLKKTISALVRSPSSFRRSSRRMP